MQSTADQFFDVVSTQDFDDAMLNLTDGNQGYKTEDDFIFVLQALWDQHSFIHAIRF